MAEAQAPMVAEAKVEANAEEVKEVKEKGPRHYQIEYPYVCIGEPNVEYVPPSSSSSTIASTVVVVEITWRRVQQCVTTINGTTTLDRRGPVETLGSSASSFDVAALLAASASASSSSGYVRNTGEDAWFDVFASFPAAAHIALFLPGSLLAALSFDLDNAIAKRPPPHLSATVLYKQELTILDTRIHDDRLLAIRDLLAEIGAPTRLSGARCDACHTLHRRELDFLRLPCSHAFHRNCISKAFRTDTRCPTCRRRFRRNDDA